MVVLERKMRTQKDRPDLAKWLRKVRAEQDLQQKEFAEAIGVSRSLIAMMERGERTIGIPLIRRVQEEFVNAPEPPFPLFPWSRYGRENSP